MDSIYASPGPGILQLCSAHVGLGEQELKNGVGYAGFGSKSHLKEPGLLTHPGILTNSFSFIGVEWEDAIHHKPRAGSPTFFWLRMGSRHSCWLGPCFSMVLGTITMGANNTELMRGVGF